MAGVAMRSSAQLEEQKQSWIPTTLGESCEIHGHLIVLEFRSTRAFVLSGGGFLRILMGGHGSIHSLS